MIGLNQGAFEDDVVVVLTPTGRGAVASVAVEGRGAANKAGRFFQSATGQPLADFSVGRIVFGRWRWDGHSEALIACRRSDRCVEIHCHGGQAAVRNIVASLESAGCRSVAWQQQAFQTSSDAIRGAARVALASAGTERTAAILLDQYRGALTNALQGAIAKLEAGHIATVEAALRELVTRAGVGLHLTQPWQVVLVGPVNVGKSSLINALLGFQRAITNERPGTTRDVLTGRLAWDGWPIEVSDTAGLRASNDAIESQGVNLARAQAARADLVLAVSDSSQPWSPAQQALRAEFPAALLVHNKSDLPSHPDRRPVGQWVSATRGTGINDLMNMVAGRLVADPPPNGAAVLFSRLQLQSVNRALEYLSQADLAAAARCLRDLLTNSGSTSEESI